jgi:NAD-dependent SIR2 family protein deacetylase
MRAFAPLIRADAGARIVIMNAEPTQFDDIADVKLSGLIGEDLPRICGRFDAA